MPRESFAVFPASRPAAATGDDRRPAENYSPENNSRHRLSVGAFAAATDTGTRSSFAALALSGTREMLHSERLHIVRKSRALRNNLGLTRRFLTAVPRMAVGPGLSASAATRDKAWNAAADRYFDRWAGSSQIDVTGQHDFYTSQAFLIGEVMTDGEAYVIQVRENDERECRLQFIKSHQVGDPFNLPGGGWYDGMKFDEHGKPVAYRITRDRDAVTGWGLATEVSAEHMLHVFDPERIHQRRGWPWLYHGVNSCIDILDLVALEKVAVKVHSYFAAAIERENGPGRQGAAATIPGASMPDPAESHRAYETLFGGAAIPVLKPGEKFHFFTSDRPATTFAGFIDFLVRDIAWGFGLSPEFVWSIAGTGGAPTRFVLEDADRFFAFVRTLCVNRYCQPVRSWVLADGMRKGRLPLCPDPEWWVCNWNGPQRMTVDRLRDGKLMLELIANGLMSYDEYWSMLNMDPAIMRRRIIDELAEDMDYAKRRDVPFGLYRKVQPGTQITIAGAGAVDTAPSA